MKKRKREEPYELRLNMAKMHDSYQKRLDKAITEGAYVEASWLCYALFEQRVSRIVEKYISDCPKQRRSKEDKPTSISTKLNCISKLIKVQYGPFSEFDKKLIKEIIRWCGDRNRLVHGLVSIEYYKKYDEEFENLAKTGAPLVKRIYDEATKVREWYRDENHQAGKFPEIACKCKRHCLFEEDWSK